MTFTVSCPVIRCCPTIVAETITVTFQFSANCWFIYSYLPSNGRLGLSLLYSQIYCIPLLTGQLSVHKQYKDNWSSGRLFVSLFCIAFQHCRNTGGLARQCCTSILNLYNKLVVISFTNTVCKLFVTDQYTLLKQYQQLHPIKHTTHDLRTTDKGITNRLIDILNAR